METKQIDINIVDARKWYYGDNAELKKIALQAFTKEELTAELHKKIITFEDALNALGYSSDYDKDYIHCNIKSVSKYSKSSAAMIKLNLVRKALNLGNDIHLTNNEALFSGMYSPYFKFYNDEDYHKIKMDTTKYIGKFESEGKLYHVISGVISHDGYGIGNYVSTYVPPDKYNNICHAHIDTGFLGCANYSIAEHLGTYFGMLILEAMYGDMIDFKVIK